MEQPADMTLESEPLLRCKSICETPLPESGVFGESVSVHEY